MSVVMPCFDVLCPTDKDSNDGSGLHVCEDNNELQNNGKHQISGFSKHTDVWPAQGLD